MEIRILSSSCHTIFLMLVMRIWQFTKMINCTVDDFPYSRHLTTTGRCINIVRRKRMLIFLGNARVKSARLVSSGVNVNQVPEHG